MAQADVLTPAGDRVSANFAQLENRDDVTLDGVEVREVVASA
jgi:hypothetical protein